MIRNRNLSTLGAAALLAFSLAVPSDATTLVRAGLDRLYEDNHTVVIAEVLEAHSYWNEEGTFILTDVVVETSQILKGELDSRELTITLMGGTVGDLTTLILGGAELVPGSSYVLFLNDEDLPGAPRVRTIRDHSQGVFDVIVNDSERLAVSQARHHVLLPDAAGLITTPGGDFGLPLTEMVRTLEALASEAKEEVTP